MDQQDKWQSLERKLAAGYPLEQACSFAGIPIDQAKDFLRAKRELEEYDSDSSRICADTARTAALAILYDACKNCVDDDVRVRAASKLIDFYLKEKTLLHKKVEESKSSKTGTNLDLFDHWIFEPTKKKPTE